MSAWTYLAVASVASVLPALWMWFVCREKIGQMAERDQPRSGRAQTAANAALGGAAAVLSVPVRSVVSAVAGRK